jgi:hypothetical protein
VQLFHGDDDELIAYSNHTEALKQWSDVLGLEPVPTSTETELQLGAHLATRQTWIGECGRPVLDAFTSLGGDHGPSDALFLAEHLVPFLGLDDTGPIDPVVAACQSAAPGGGGPGDAGSGSGEDAGGAAAPDSAEGSGAAPSPGRPPPSADADGLPGSGNAMGANPSGDPGGARAEGAPVRTSGDSARGCSLASQPRRAGLRWSWGWLALIALGSFRRARVTAARRPP